MTAYTEKDLKYIEGVITGILGGYGHNPLRDTKFDQEALGELGGELIVYETFPAFPNEEAARKQETRMSLMEWDDEIESFRLLEDGEVPTDRNGELVLDDGTVVISHNGKRQMFRLTENELQTVTNLANHWSEVLDKM